MKTVSIIGARPQIIKHAIIKENLNLFYKNKIKDITIHTGQHYNFKLSDTFFKELAIDKPEYNLNISKLKHSEMVGKMVMGIGKILRYEKPKMVILYGDTNSTLAGAISASKEKIPIAHIESGLRSFNLKMPEEINRILTDRVSSILFCPSQAAKKNLISESYNLMKDKIIFNHGDVMFDLHKKFKNKFKIRNDYNDYFLVTIHREENTNKKTLSNIIKNLSMLSNYQKIIMPAHPRIKKYLNKKIKTKNIRIIEPQGYIEFGNLIYNSKLVITDSGGVQKESHFFKKNCIVLRNETEWVELINKKINYLINPENKEFYKLILNKKFKKNVKNFLPYGNGNSGSKIVKSIYQYLK
jgi:UDP-GlcNAc3NAcA epimerase